MDTTVLADSLEGGIARLARNPDAPGDEDVHRTDRAEHRPADLPQPSRLVAIRVTSIGRPADPVLADLMEKAFEALDRNPNNLHNNPEKRREAAEGFQRLMEEWQAENGSFTTEQLQRADAILYGP